jgi:hypothetical protein
MLFEVAVLQKPTAKEAEDGKQETLVLEPTCVVAVDDKAAAMKVMQKENVKLREMDADRMIMLVRPFA